MFTRQAKICVFFAAIVLMGAGRRVDAQTFSLPFDLNESSPAVDFAVDANGNLLDRGPLTDTGSVAPVSTMAAGSQLLWSPAYAIFRAGYFTTALSTTNMGEYSVALGYNSAAQGEYSVGIGGGSAMGTWAVAIGPNSSAAGSGADALGSNSLAPGSSAIAIGGGDATGPYGFAMGTSSTASGQYAMALGPYSTATGYFATAFGSNSMASGNYSLALGYSSVGNSTYGTAVGYGTSTGSYASFVAGTYNLDLSETGATPNGTAWVATDPIFEVGNGQGTGSAPRSTALVIYKNGDTAFPIPTSSVTASKFMMTVPSGDVPMFTGN